MRASRHMKTGQGAEWGRIEGERESGHGELGGASEFLPRPGLFIWRTLTRTSTPRQRCLHISKCSLTASAAIRPMATSLRWPMSRR
jgi:hypothetical protein